MQLYRIHVNKAKTQAHVYFWLIDKTVGFYDSSGRVIDHVLDFLGGGPYKYHPGLIPTRAELYQNETDDDKTEIVEVGE